MTNRQILIERVQKLLDRAANDFGPESSLARAEADRLIGKHAITADEIKQEGRHVRAALEDPCLSGHAALCAGPWDEIRSPFAAMLVTTFFTSQVVCFGADDCAYVVGPRLCIPYDRDRYLWVMERFQELWLAHLSKWRERAIKAVNDFAINQAFVFAPPVAHPGPMPVEVDFYLGLFRGFRLTLAGWRVQEMHNAAMSAARCRALVHAPTSPDPAVPPPSEVGTQAHEAPPRTAHRTLKVTPKNPYSIRAGEAVGAEEAQKLVCWARPVAALRRVLSAPDRQRP